MKFLHDILKCVLSGFFVGLIWWILDSISTHSGMLTIAFRDYGLIWAAATGGAVVALSVFRDL